jgi:hypothetical protein
VTGDAAKAEAKANMGGAGKITYITNNLPYIQQLEYGGNVRALATFQPGAGVHT